MLAWFLTEKHALWRLIDEGFFALAIAVGCYVVLYALQPVLFLGDVGLVIQDRVLQLEADTRTSATVPPFVVLDIDNTNYRRLGYPPVIPHRVLSDLLEIASAGAPRLIIVDVDIGWPDKSESEAALSQTLQAIAQKGEPTVLLVRQPFRHDDVMEPTILRPTRFDQLVEHSRNLLWVTALAPTDGDGITRRFLPGKDFFRECPARASQDQREMSLTPVPSAQVAACAALAGSEAVDRLKLSLSPRTGCSANPEPAGEAALTQRSLNFPCGGHDWPLLASAEFGSRVLYTMRWKLPEGFARPQRPWPGNDLPVQEVEVMNALDVIAYAAQIDPIQQYGGRIVIIGSSANDIGDVFRTSVGTMPGFLIIANAIRSGVETGPVYASSGYLSGLLVTIVMTMMTFALWLWCRQHPMYGVMLFKYSALVLGTVVWFFAATWVLSSGQTIEFVFPQYLATAYLLFAESWRSVV